MHAAPLVGLALCLLWIGLPTTDAATALQSGVQVSGTTTSGVMACYSYTITSQTTEAWLLPEITGPTGSSNKVTLYMRYGTEPTTSTYGYSINTETYASRKGVPRVVVYSQGNEFMRIPEPLGTYYYCMYSVLAAAYTLKVTAMPLADLTLSTNTARQADSAPLLMPFYLPIPSVHEAVAFGFSASMGTVYLNYVDSSGTPTTPVTAVTSPMILNNATTPALKAGGYSVAAYSLLVGTTFDLWLCTSTTSCPKPNGGNPTPTPTAVPLTGAAGSVGPMLSVGGLVAVVLGLVGV